MSWKVCEPAYRREWRCITSASGSTSNSVVLAWPLPTCWDGDLKTHTKRLSTKRILPEESHSRDQRLTETCRIQPDRSRRSSRTVFSFLPKDRHKTGTL